MSGKIWASIDPVHEIVHVYPKWVATKIEEKYNTLKDNRFNEQIINLGADFHNATIHLRENNYYQTTPGYYCVRGGGGKPPGYRPILPISVIDNKFTVYGRRIKSELRITKNQCDSDITFNETISNTNDILQNEILNTNDFPPINPWKPEDLLEESNNNKYVCVWLWCRGVPEKQGNLFKLTDNWWSPYLCNDNKLIEESFTSRQASVEITLFNSTKRTIQFSSDFSCYAKQIKEASLHDSYQAVRYVKRVLMKIGDLKEKIRHLNSILIDISILSELVVNDDIPNEFYCSISQDIMRDPVKTIDNHTYDRESIERWFMFNNTSPLTGLPLNSLDLVPNNELKEQIILFTRLQIEKNNN